MSSSTGWYVGPDCVIAVIWFCLSSVSNKLVRLIMVARHLSCFPMFMFEQFRIVMFVINLVLSMVKLNQVLVTTFISRFHVHRPMRRKYVNLTNLYTSLTQFVGW